MNRAHAHRTPLGGRLTPRPAELSPVAAVARGLAILSVAWQALTLFPDPANWPGRQASVVAAGLLAVSMLAWLGIVVSIWGPLADARRRQRLQVVNALVLLPAALVLLATEPIAEADGWLAAATVFDLAVGLTGLTLAMRWSVPVIGLAIAVEALLVEVGPTAGPAGWVPDNLLYAFYAAAIAAATIGSRAGLNAAARTSQAAQEAALTAQAQSQAVEQIDRRVREQARRLHETVLNTLTAIARGGHDPDDARLRARCTQSVEVLESMRDIGVRSAAQPDIVTALAPELDDLRARGVQVVVAGTWVERPPADVEQTMTGAAREALHNVMRHAQATRVEVLLAGADSGEPWHLRIVDDGRGFDPAQPTRGFGITDAIERALREAGGTAVVTSAPDSGTTVDLRWGAPVHGGAPESISAISSIVFVLPMVGSFALFSTASLLVSWASYGDLPRALAAYVLAMAAGVVIVASARRGVLTFPVIVAVCLAAPVIYRLQVSSLVPGTASMWAEWSSEMAMALLFAVASAGPWWAWIAALSAWLVTQGNVLTELLQPGTAIIVAGALYARSIRTNTRAFREAQGRRSRELVAQTAEREGTRVLTRRYAALTESAAPQLLAAIADGSADPDDPAIRQECALEERYIRSVMRLDPQADPLQAMAMRLAQAAHRHRLVLSVDIAEDVRSGPESGPVLDALERSFTACLDLLASDEGARLSARVEGGGVVIRLVAQGRPDVSMAALSEAPMIFVDASDGTVMWEVQDV